MSHIDTWKSCLTQLQTEITQQEFSMWINPLQVQESSNGLCIFAPNQIVLHWLKDNCLPRILALIKQISPDSMPQISLDVGSVRPKETQPPQAADVSISPSSTTLPPAKPNTFANNHASLNQNYHMERFVVGKSNMVAHAAALQTAENPGQSFNPLSIYGGVGLGKTHLMQGIGNLIKQRNPNAKIIYVHAERFVADMVKALQHNLMNEFKQWYRDADALLIDDIQFFAGKGRSQEEFFHTFNALLERGQQIVLTCDKYPKEINGLEERLKSRFGWGLTVSVEPPELETRVAILMSKAEQSKIALPDEVTFFIAQRIQSNVRELEGALKRVIANAHFTGQPITLAFAQEALKDLLAVQAKLVSLANIQKTVAEYYKVTLNEMLSKRRSRYIARARQVAMALAKELTQHSLPEIGEAFGGRDHTTVLHACRKIQELLKNEPNIKEDYTNLLRVLST